MAVHTAGRDNGAANLPSVFPLDVPNMSRLSWALGSRVVDDEESTPLCDWTHTETTWGLSVYRVTRDTVVLRLYTPVGRERFYGAAWDDLRSNASQLENDAGWRRVG